MSTRRTRTNPRRASASALRRMQTHLLARPNTTPRRRRMVAEKEIGLPVHESYPPPARAREGALVQSMDEYRRLYDRSIHDADAFWSEMANTHLDWMAP